MDTVGKELERKYMDEEPVRVIVVARKAVITKYSECVTVP